MTANSRAPSMWDFIFGFIPEKRQPGAVSVLAFLSITLPLLAAVSALLAWKLNDRLSRQRQPAESPGARLAPAAEPDQETKSALAAAQNTLKQTEVALHQTEAELEQERAGARLALSAA